MFALSGVQVMLSRVAPLLVAFLLVALTSGVVLGQDPPPPRAVIRGGEVLNPSLFDGHKAWVQLAAAWSQAKDNARNDPAVTRAAADQGLAYWSRGDRIAAVRTWHQLRSRLLGLDSSHDEFRASIKFALVDDGECTPHLRECLSNGVTSSHVRVSVRSLYGLELPLVELLSGQELQFSVDYDWRPDFGRGGPYRGSRAIHFDRSGRLLPVGAWIPVGPMAWGERRIDLDFSGAACAHVAVYNSPRSAEQLRVILLEDVAAEADGSAVSMSRQLSAAKGTYASRVQLIQRSADEGESASFVHVIGLESARLASGAQADNGLLNALAIEAAALKRGESPYTCDGPLGRAGRPFWQTFLHRDQEVRAWVRLPDRLATAGAGAKVVVALHIGGFDEGWFVSIPGADKLFDADKKRSALIVALDTHVVAEDPTVLRSVLDGPELDTRIDRSQVFVLGLGLGAEVAAELESKTDLPIAAIWSPTKETLKGHSMVLDLTQIVTEGMSSLLSH